MMHVRVLKNSSYNSLKLHFLQQIIQENQKIKRAEVMMGTEANKAYLKEVDLFNEDIAAADANNLVIIAEAEEPSLVDALIAQANVRLERHLEKQKATERQERRKNYLPQKEVKSPFFFRDFQNKRKMGKLHSVFRSSFNVMFGEELLNFSTVGMPVAPHGIVLAKEKINRVLESGQIGDIVKIEEQRITFYTRREIFVFDAAKIEEINLEIPKLAFRKSHLKEALETLNFSEHIGLQAVGDVRKSLDVLKNMVLEEKTEVEIAVRYLIGRGDGLTPSGDDILLGYSMVRQAFLNEDGFVVLLEKVLNQRSTTAISDAYYDGLLAGYINSLFLALLNMGNRDSDGFSQTLSLTKLITHYGHTSGYDTLYGMFLGLESIEK